MCGRSSGLWASLSQERVLLVGSSAWLLAGDQGGHRSRAAEIIFGGGAQSIVVVITTAVAQPGNENPSPRPGDRAAVQWHLGDQWAAMCSSLLVRQEQPGGCGEGWGRPVWGAFRDLLGLSPGPWEPGPSMLIEAISAEELCPSTSRGLQGVATQTRGHSEVVPAHL